MRATLSILHGMKAQQQGSQRRYAMVMEPFFAVEPSIAQTFQNS